MSATTQQQNALRGVIADLQAKLVRRHGDFGIHRAFRAITGSTDLAEARCELAELSARMPDEAFDAMVQSGATVRSLMQALCLAGAPMRRVVCDAAWTALCTRANGGLPQKNAAAVGLSTDFLQSQYDVSRFVEIKNGVITAEQALKDFADAFPVGRADPVSAEEFAALCSGVSLQRPTDQKHYELHVMRSWNLDRSFGGAAVERQEIDKQLAGSSGSDEHEQQQSQGRSHPLYQTASSKIGVNASEGAKHAVIQFHRAGRFTKENPAPSPSCGLNVGGSSRKSYM